MKRFKICIHREQLRLLAAIELLNAFAMMLCKIKATQQEQYDEQSAFRRAFLAGCRKS
jgi:hypothetical protein